MPLLCPAAVLSWWSLKFTLGERARSESGWMLNFRFGLWGRGVNIKTGRAFCAACLGSDKSSGGSHGVLWTEVDIVLLLPVDPVGPWALSVEKHKCRSQKRTASFWRYCTCWFRVSVFFLLTILSLCFSCSLSEFYAGRLFSKLI